MHWDAKINPTLDGILKEKRLSVSVSGKEHKLLGIASLRKNLRNIYGERVCVEVMNLLKDGTVLTSFRIWFLTLQASIQGVPQVIV